MNILGIQIRINPWYKPLIVAENSIRASYEATTDSELDAVPPLIHPRYDGNDPQQFIEDTLRANGFTYPNAISVGWEINAAA